MKFPGVPRTEELHPRAIPGQVSGNETNALPGEAADQWSLDTSRAVWEILGPRASGRRPVALAELSAGPSPRRAGAAFMPGRRGIGTTGGALSVKPTVVFVCFQNAGRSRIAEAYLDSLAGDRYQAASAGLQPADHTHPEAIEVMAEEGILIEDRAGQLLTSPVPAEIARVVALNCTVDDIDVPVEAWDIPDGPGDKVERARTQRDSIRQRVIELIEELDASFGPQRGDRRA